MFNLKHYSGVGNKRPHAEGVVLGVPLTMKTIFHCRYVDNNVIATIVNTLRMGCL